MSEDRDYQIKAIQLLDDSLSDIDAFPDESGIDKQKLIEMYIDSRNIVRLNVENLELNRAAESVWSTCIRVVRCTGIIGADAKILIIKQKANHPEAKNLYDHAIVLYKKMKKLEPC